jgi:hypothetical protein
MVVYSPDDILAVEQYLADLAVSSRCGIAAASLKRALGESIVRLISPLR